MKYQIRDLPTDTRIMILSFLSKRKIFNVMKMQGCSIGDLILLEIFNELHYYKGIYISNSDRTLIRRSICNELKNRFSWNFDISVRSSFNGIILKIIYDTTIFKKELLWIYYDNRVERYNTLKIGFPKKSRSLSNEWPDRIIALEIEKWITTSI